MIMPGVLKTMLSIIIWPLLLFNLITVYAGTPKYWQTSAYAFEGNNTSIKTVLQDFSDSFGVNLIMSNHIKGISNGWKRSESAINFLDQLSQEYKLQWFVYNQNLYISSQRDNVVERLFVKPNVSSELKKAIVGIGLFEKKFGWGVLNEEGIILVSGPKKYVNFIRGFVSEDIQQNKSSDIFIYPLNHALVVDRTIHSRGETTTIPGVATILQNLLEGKNRSITGLSIPEVPSVINTMSKTTTSSIKPTTTNGKVGGKKTVVEADVRTNSIIIKSSEKNYSYYKNLISKLDIPQNLVEIDAVIVDINKNKLNEVGIDWQFNNNGEKNSITASTILGSRHSLSANATISIDELGIFYTKIKALEATGDASIVANTSILTMENQPAVIDLSETRYIQTVGERVANLESVTAGTLLNVTPGVLVSEGANNIILTLEIEDGALEKTENQITPSVIKATISTKAMITEYHSLVVGGYHMHSTETNIKRVPFFGSLPIIGSLFSSQTEKKTNKERLFILTPKVSGSSHNVAAYSSTGNSKLIIDSVAEIEKRWQQANKIYVDKSVAALASIVNGQIPNGYRLQRHVAKRFEVNCSQPGVEFSFNQKFSGRQLSIYSGVVKNFSNTSIAVSESACVGNGLVVVSLFPNKLLNANDHQFIYIVVESDLGA